MHTPFKDASSRVFLERFEEKSYTDWLSDGSKSGGDMSDVDVGFIARRAIQSRNLREHARIARGDGIASEPLAAFALKRSKSSPAPQFQENPLRPSGPQAAVKAENPEEAVDPALSSRAKV